MLFGEKVEIKGSDLGDISTRQCFERMIHYNWTERMLSELERMPRKQSPRRTGLYV